MQRLVTGIHDRTSVCTLRLLSALLVLGGCECEGSAPPAEPGPNDASMAEPMCLGATLGALRSENPSLGVRVFDSCDREGEVVVVWEGGVRASDEESLGVLKDNVTAELFAIEGVIGLGVERCCRDEEESPFCLSLEVQTHTLSMDELIQELTRVFDGHVECVGVRVTPVGYEEPRCTPEDIDCGPFSMCERSDEVCCPVLAAYDPEGPRIPVGSEYDSLSGGSCEHDGDCVPLGCGLHCMSYDTPGFIGTCECYSGLSAAHCGCVDNRCAWFTQ